MIYKFDKHNYIEFRKLTWWESIVLMSCFGVMIILGIIF
jgi:hypothetical protein